MYDGFGQGRTFSTESETGLGSEYDGREEIGNNRIGKGHVSMRVGRMINRQPLGGRAGVVVARVPTTTIGTS